jgi:CRISPR-associated protein Cmr6
MWRGERIERGPGAIYRALFGAPDAETDEAMRGQGFDAGAAAGIVTFHDALYVPQRNGVNDTPFIPDVLTVHQKQYYDTGGGAWPSDYDSPNPVAFLTVSPGVRMLFALSGPPDWTQLTEQLLRGALEKWGVGGKTSAGYGRLIAPERGPANILSAQSTVTGGLASPKVGDRVQAELLEQRTKRGAWKARHKSGLEGPIQDNDHVSSDKKAGDLISVIVKIAKGRESAFMVDAARGKVDPKKGGGK